MSESHSEPAWMDASWKKAGRYLILLLRAGITGQPVMEKPEDVSWNQILHLARMNSVSVIAFYGALLSNKDLPEELKKAWKREVLFLGSRQIQMEADRKRLAEKMDEEHAYYLFIKGIIMQDLYPKPEMRQMSDNDILYRYESEEVRGLKSKSQMKMKQIMQDLGAKAVSDDGIVDVFMMEPYSLFEMHRDFMGPDQPLYWYFKDIWKRAKKKEDASCQYRLSWEDAYILMLAHSYKHYSSAGCGPREILDVHQFITQKGDLMNWEYIHEELRLIHLEEYEALLRSLSDLVFESPMSSAFENLDVMEKANESDTDAAVNDWDLVDWFVSNGTYGSRVHDVENSLSQIESEGLSRRQAKMKYFWNRLFPRPEYLQTHYPFFYRHRSLIGFLLVYRTVKGIKQKKDDLKKEFELVSKA